VRVEGVVGLSSQTLVQDGSRASLEAAPDFVTRHCTSALALKRSQALLAIRQLNWPATTLHETVYLQCMQTNLAKPGHE